MTAPTTARNRHSALLYDATDQLLAAAVPFLEAGLRAGEAVVLVCRRPINTLLADVLNARGRITALSRTGIYTRGARALAFYRDLFDRLRCEGAPGIRTVSEIDFGSSPGAWTGWTEFEALANLALTDLPLSNVCAFDTALLPDPLRDSVMRTHPFVLTDQGPIRNDRYQDPVEVLRRLNAEPPDPLENTPPTCAITGLRDLAQVTSVRERLYDALAGADIPPPVRSAFVAALHEVTVNGLQHGRPPVGIRIWATPTRLLAAVTDTGTGFDDPLAGYLHHDGDLPRPGSGLWLVRQVCDYVHTTRGPGGFTVRLSTAIPADTQGCTEAT